jgi:hypothetical protein
MESWGGSDESRTRLLTESGSSEFEQDLQWIWRALSMTNSTLAKKEGSVA